MAKSTTYQFLRIQGFPRGARSKRGTLGSILAEGMREPTHISHLEAPPDIRVERVSSPVESPADLYDWIGLQMEETQNYHVRNGQQISRRVRSDALSIGTVVVSHPLPTDECGDAEFQSFVEDTTAWVKRLLNDYEMLLHFRLTHLDEKYPHLHFWFTPLPNEERKLNWSMSTLCGQNKRFYHTLQIRFFDEVGHKFCDERAKPLEDRNPRLPRHIAVQRRKEIEHHQSQARVKASEVTLAQVSTFIEAIGERHPRKEEVAEPFRLSDKAQSIIQSMGMAPNIADALNHDKAALAKESAQMRERLTQTSRHSGKRESQPDIGPWINELLFPVLLDVAFQQGSRAEHLGQAEWLTLVVEEAAGAIEDKLTQLELDHSGMGEQVARAVRDSGFVESVLAARKRSNTDTRRRLEASVPAPEQGRLSAAGSTQEAGSPWDQIIPR